MCKDLIRLLILSPFIFPILCQAGIYTEKINVVSARVFGETRFEIVVQPSLRQAGFFVSCPSLTIVGDYLLGAPESRKAKGISFPAWVTRETHISALRRIQNAFKNKTALDLGWIGTGLQPIGAKKDCKFRSRGLTEFVIYEGEKNEATAVLTLHNPT